jgi:ppGpp synthetase/RelA/SpoT-type nucleotidyltranferase
MRIKISKEPYDELIAKRIELALETQMLADSMMHILEKNAPIYPLPDYHPRQEKRRSRILAKIKRYQTEDPRLRLSDAIDKVDDLAGGRFLVHYLDDVHKLYHYVCTEITKRDDITLEGNCRDCIENPKTSGFRALTQDTYFKLSPDLWFPFELQIMTFLSHDWDQKQHALYENRDEIPQSVHHVFAELSQKLYEADKTFVRVRGVMGAFTKSDKLNK